MDLSNKTAPTSGAVPTVNDPDPSITRVPFSTEGTFWTGDDVRLYRMASTLRGAFGEAADYLLTSTVFDAEGQGPETIVVPSDSDGTPASDLSPVMRTADSADVETILADLGFVDVTTEA